MSKKILITGADGFIGSHLTEALVRQGHDVRAFTLYNSFNAWGWLDHCEDDVKNQFEVFQGDVRDPNGVRMWCNGQSELCCGPSGALHQRVVWELGLCVKFNGSRMRHAVQRPSGLAADVL